MRPIATGTQRGLSFCVCLSVWLDNKPCKNGKTDRDAGWVVDSGGPKEPGIRFLRILLQGKEQVGGGCSRKNSTTVCSKTLLLLSSLFFVVV